MPNVNGMKFPYTPAGKAAAKKAAVSSMKTGSKKKSFSGLRSQIYGG